MPGEHLPCKQYLDMLQQLDYRIAYDRMLTRCRGSQMQQMLNRKSYQLLI